MSTHKLFTTTTTELDTQQCWNANCVSQVDVQYSAEYLREEKLYVMLLTSIPGLFTQLHPACLEYAI